MTYTPKLPMAENTIISHITTAAKNRISNTTRKHIAATHVATESHVTAA